MSAETNEFWDNLRQGIAASQDAAASIAGLSALVADAMRGFTLVPTTRLAELTDLEERQIAQRIEAQQAVHDDDFDWGEIRPLDFVGALVDPFPNNPEQQLAWAVRHAIAGGASLAGLENARDLILELVRGPQ